MPSSPFHIHRKADLILPVHDTALPSQELKIDGASTTKTSRNRFLRANLNKLLICFTAFGIVAATLTLLLGWLLGRRSIPTVTLPQGQFQGIVINRPNFPKPVQAHLGIPYAQPPVGDLRFARPRPVLPSNEIFEASGFGQR